MLMLQVGELVSRFLRAAPGFKTFKTETKEVKEELEVEFIEDDNDYVVEDSYVSDSDDDDEDDEYVPSKEETVKVEKTRKAKKRKLNEDHQFSCPECDQTFKKKALVKQHQLRVHDKIVRFSCFVCQKGFYDRHHMITHLSIHDDARKLEERFLPDDLVSQLKQEGQVDLEGRKVTVDMVCLYCSKVFELEKSRRKHEEAVHMDDHKHMLAMARKEREVSSKVDESATDESAVEDKSNIKLFDDNGDVPSDAESIYKCSECERILPSAGSLEIHLRIHQEQSVIPCTAKNCTATFFTSKQLLDHKLSDHGMSKEAAASWTCEECGKVFKRKGCLKMHMKKHNPDKNFVCNDCGKKFKRETGLHFHTLKFHKGILNYSCDECGKSEVSPAALSVHIQNKHKAEEQTVMCPVCSKLMSKYYLNKHMTTHTDERKFECKWPGCDKKFRMDSVLKNHEKWHAGIKDYQCPMCPKQFIQQQQLMYHLKRHNGIKDFECKTCGKAFVEPAGARNCKHSGMQDLKSRLALPCAPSSAGPVHPPAPSTPPAPAPASPLPTSQPPTQTMPNTLLLPPQARTLGPGPYSWPRPSPGWTTRP